MKTPFALVAAACCLALGIPTCPGAEEHPAQLMKKAPPFPISAKVLVSTPDSAINESFRIAAELVVAMRRVAYQHYGHKDGWLAVSMGKNGPAAVYDPRDFRYGPKWAAYLWGDDRALMREMGKRIILDEHDKNGRLTWDWNAEDRPGCAEGQCAIHIAQVAKHFSDYLRYSHQDQFIKDHWDRQLKIIKWTLAAYDRNGDGLIEQGHHATVRVWALLVGEPFNTFILDRTQDDVVVVASMEVCEWLQLMAAYGEANHLPEADWLKEKAALANRAIETHAYDPDAGYYYLLRRTAENRWYHSGCGINEESRELDVTPYYAAFVSGNDSRGYKVAQYARKVLLHWNIFPMPLMYPSYYWACPNYGTHGFVPGGCWEEAYYNCVRAFVKYRMLDAAYTAVKRRSDAHVRDKQCIEWYSVDGHAYGRDQYGISGAAHVSAIIEGLFGITPTQFGFQEVNVWPAIPAIWADHPATIQVALPDGGFLKYSYLFAKKAKRLTVTIETDRERQGHFRIPVPGECVAILWNGQNIYHNCNVAFQAGRPEDLVYIDRPFKKDVITIGVR
jgi:hypothetical protein